MAAGGFVDEVELADQVARMQFQTIPQLEQGASRTEVSPRRAVKRAKSEDSPDRGSASGLTRTDLLGIASPEKRKRASTGSSQEHSGSSLEAQAGTPTPVDPKNLFSPRRK